MTSLAHQKWRTGLTASILFLMVLCVMFAPVFRTALGLAQEGVDLDTRFAGPSLKHWLGQDELGRDYLLRLLEGGQVTWLVGSLGAVMATFLGGLIGLLAAICKGGIDRFLMRLTECMMALPLLPVLIVLAAIDLTKLGLSREVAESDATNIVRMILIVSLFSWTNIARLVRTRTLHALSKDYVHASVALGAGQVWLFRKHIWPEIFGIILVSVALTFGRIVVMESALSFIGIGIQPPMPSWGNMLTGAEQTVFEAPALAIYPGLLIFISVALTNSLADGLQRFKFVYHKF